MAEKIPLPATQEENINHKRKLIVDAAREIFARQGYEATTIAEIATAAGIAVGTVYLYFQNKREIYIDASLSWVGEIAAELLRPEILLLPIKQVPRGMIEKSFQICRKNYHFMSLIQIDIQSTKELEAHRRAEALITQALNAFLLQCVARGDLLPFDTAMYAKIIFGLVDHVLYDCFFLNGGNHEELYREQTIDVLERLFFGPSLRGSAK